MNGFPRGSEWRRWDLHIHTPGTIKNDLFDGVTLEDKWDKFYDDIAQYVGDDIDPTKSIAVIGITDYLSIDNYKRVVLERRLPNSIKLILPNIEMRIQPFSGDSPINIHFIFNPEVADQLESRFFAKLTFSGPDTKYSACRSELIRFGRSFDPSLDELMAYKKGIEHFVVSFDAVEKVFIDDPELREHAIIGVSNGSNDGVSGAVNHSSYLENGVHQLSGLRRTIYRFVDFIFSATPSDIAYFLGKKPNSPPEIVIKQCGALMACVHGCDAHENAKIFDPDLKRYCWIKADPTFNGLTQIVCEPEERVCISETKPQVKPSYQVIESITFSHSDFQSDPIVFNDKLNCIIGGKSTGKSILLHNLALAISPKQVEEKCAITSIRSRNDKKRTATTLELDPSTISVRWLDGHESIERKIVYIPQTYLNRLADSSEDTTEIDNIVELILLDKKDFNGVHLSIAKKTLLTKIDSLKSDNTNKLLELIRRYEQIEQKKGQISDLGGKTLVEKEIEKLRKQRDELSRTMNLKEDDVKSFDEAISNIELQTTVIAQIEKDIVGIHDATAVVQRSDVFSGLSNDTLAEIRAMIDDIILKANDSWNLQKDQIILRLVTRKAVCVQSRSASEIIRDRLRETIESSKAIKELTDRLAIESEKLKRIEELEEQIAEEQIQYTVLLEGISTTFFGVRSDYEEFARYINENTQSEGVDLSYLVQIPFRQEDFLAKWAEVYGIKSLKSRELVNASDFTSANYNIELIKSTIEKTLSGELAPIKGFTKEQALRSILDDWFNIKYIVKMGSDTIEKMSPGKKALVLLKLLIELADSDCPILIDQPEDDLDNRSIYDQLIEFIRSKKVNRQIIIVTHNANIVLGADSDEVIVANQDGIGSEKRERRFEYRSGSIENDCAVFNAYGTIECGVLNSRGIQQHICDILEGGITAFEKRKNKYHI